eukprot:3876168-Rhodomonas_salina.2
MCRARRSHAGAIECRERVSTAAGARSFASAMLLVRPRLCGEAETETLPADLRAGFLEGASFAAWHVAVAGYHTISPARLKIVQLCHLETACTRRTRSSLNPQRVA